VERLHLVRVHLVRVDVVGFDVVGFVLVGLHLVGVDVVGLHLVGFDVVGLHLVGLDVVGLDVVGVHLVRRELVMRLAPDPVSARGVRIAATAALVALTALQASPAFAKPTKTVTSTATVSTAATPPAPQLESVAQLEGARDAWACGWNGAGVDVALIDTGVTPVPGTGTIVNGPDLSFDAQTGAPPYLDAFGHGTQLASIINGSDPGVTVSGGCRLNGGGNVVDGMTVPSATGFAGIAPGARVVNLKVGAADGAVDPTQVIAAIDWAVAHRNTGGLNIRVLVLAYGVPSTNDVVHDALSHAVEVARRNGIVVIASAGNDGTTLADLAFPARNPDVVAVGAADDTATTTLVQWSVASFSDRGTATRGADVLTLGVDVAGLRVPGSYVDTVDPTTTGDRFVRGSGTSQAAAVAAGLAAQLIQRYPSATPDQVKAMLGSSAMKITLKSSPYAQGHGAIVGDLFLKATLPQSTSTAPLATIGDAPINNDRQDATLALDGVALNGELDVQGNPWPGAAWAAAATTTTSWNGGLWLAHPYTGAAMTTAGWATAAWPTSWSGTPWAGVGGSGGTWNGVRWNGLRWNGTTWAGLRWNGVRWNGVRWNAIDWSGLRWNGVRWN
jgi:serine protease AprX